LTIRLRRFPEHRASINAAIKPLAHGPA
jgi:hypothetical protein